MLNKTFIITFVLSVVSPFVKGTFYHPRLVMLAVAGLAGMYMVHLLADDYNTYQSYNRPAPKLFGKRSIPDDVFGLRKNITEKAAPLDRQRDLSNHIARLDMILRFDPTGCARRYVCTVAAKSPKKLTISERNVMNMVRGVTRNEKSSGVDAFRSAMELGKRKKDAEACSAEYPKCIFTVSQMLSPLEQPSSYRPISLFPIFSKILEKIIMSKLKPVLRDNALIPDFQFGFRDERSTIEQVRRVVRTINNAFEAEEYSTAVLLDVARAFDKVWHDGLEKLCPPLS